MAKGPKKRVYTTNYPADGALVEMAARLGTLTAVATAVGVKRESFADYLARRPALNCTVRAHLRQQCDPWTPEKQRKAAREHKRRKQIADPEAVRAANRRWARNVDTEVRRGWNERNRLNRASAAYDADALNYVRALRCDPCSYCGASCEHIDHIDAIAAGGAGAWDNLTASCASCNRRKRAKKLLEFLHG